jgi:NADH:ubiquinone oxidoreductase subunit F (NADH-binding)
MPSAGARGSGQKAAAEILKQLERRYVTGLALVQLRIAAGYATRATAAYFYLRYEYGRCYRTLQKAID